MDKAKLKVQLRKMVSNRSRALPGYIILCKKVQCIQSNFIFNDRRNTMIALVTGASRGIGAAAARRLAADGYTVLVHYCSAGEKAMQIAAETGGEAVQADLGDFAQIDRMAEDILSRYGKIDALVNNAGIALTGLYQDISDADALRLMTVDLGGAMHLTDATRLTGVAHQARHSQFAPAAPPEKTGASCVRRSPCARARPHRLRSAFPRF
jgi:3-oxoacyl-[acyl-carrier protein] reductase